MQSLRTKLTAASTILPLGEILATMRSMVPTTHHWSI